MASVAGNIQKFLEAQAGFDKPFVPDVMNGVSVYRWEGSTQMVPVRLRTGPNPCGNPFERKWFSSIELNGEAGGWFVCRVWVDGRLVVSSVEGSFAEAPGMPRRVRLPRGTKGYFIDMEIVFTGRFRGAEVFFDSMIVGGGGGGQQ